MIAWPVSVPAVRGQMKTRPSPSDAGSALVAAIGLSAVIALLAVMAVRMVVHSAVLANAAQTGLARNEAIEAVTLLSLAELAAAETPVRWGQTSEVSWLNEAYRVTWWSPDGQVDLNAAPPAMLEAAFRAAGAELPDRLASAVIDWRDADDLASLGGAEATAYQRTGLPGPANRPFRHEAELASVIGVSEQLASCMARFVTVSSWREAPVLELAPAELRDALAATQSANAPAELPLLNEVGQLIGLRIEPVTPQAGQGSTELRVRLSGQATQPILIQAIDPVIDTSCAGQG